MKITQYLCCELDRSGKNRHQLSRELATSQGRSGPSAVTSTVAATFAQAETRQFRTIAMVATALNLEIYLKRCDQPLSEAVKITL